MKTKMLKMVNDPCFGQNYEKEDQCPGCWIKKSCFAVYRNRK